MYLDAASQVKPNELFKSATRSFDFLASWNSVGTQPAQLVAIAGDVRILERDFVDTLQRSVAVADDGGTSCKQSGAACRTLLSGSLLGDQLTPVRMTAANTRKEAMDIADTFREIGTGFTKALRSLTSIPGAPQAQVQVRGTSRLLNAPVGGANGNKQKAGDIPKLRRDLEQLFVEVSTFTKWWNIVASVLEFIEKSTGWFSARMIVPSAIASAIKDWERVEKMFLHYKLNICKLKQVPARVPASAPPTPTIPQPAPTPITKPIPVISTATISTSTATSAGQTQTRLPLVPIVLATPLLPITNTDDTIEPKAAEAFESFSLSSQRRIDVRALVEATCKSFEVLEPWDLATTVSPHLQTLVRKFQHQAMEFRDAIDESVKVFEDGTGLCSDCEDLCEYLPDLSCTVVDLQAYIQVLQEGTKSAQDDAAEVIKKLGKIKDEVEELGKTTITTPSTPVKSTMPARASNFFPVAGTIFLPSMIPMHKYLFTASGIVGEMESEGRAKEERLWSDAIKNLSKVPNEINTIVGHLQAFSNWWGSLAESLSQLRELAGELQGKVPQEELDRVRDNWVHLGKYLHDYKSKMCRLQDYYPSAVDRSTSQGEL